MLIGNQIQHALTKMIDNKKKIHTEIAGYTKYDGNTKNIIKYSFQVIITDLDLIVAIGKSDKVQLSYFQKFISDYRPQTIKEYDEVFDLPINAILNNYVNEKINQISNIMLDGFYINDHVFTMNLIVNLQIEQ